MFLTIPVFLKKFTYRIIKTSSEVLGRAIIYKETKKSKVKEKNIFINYEGWRI